MSALRDAESAIVRAEAVRVANYPSLELTEARQKLVAAHAAVAREEMTLASRLAEQARLDAELATAIAETIKIQRVNEEMRRGTEVLRQELERQRPTTENRP